MQLHSFERRSSYIFFAIPNQTHELFFAPPGIYIYIYIYIPFVQPVPGLKSLFFKLIEQWS